MTEELQDRFIKPIVNACYPGTLAALNLTVLNVMGLDAPDYFKVPIAFGSMMFLIASFSIFFYTIYPTKRKLWTTTALSFLIGLVCSLIAVLVFMIV